MLTGTELNETWQLQRHRIALRARYLRTGVVADLEEAIQLARHILELTPEHSPDRAEKLNGLANSLGDRYLRFGAMTDLNESIEVARQVVVAAPDGCFDQAMYLNDLAVPLADRYKRTGAIADLEEAIRVMEKAVGLFSEDHPHRAMCLSNLGCYLADRYDKTRAMADLDESIRIQRQALDATVPSNHWDRIGRPGRLHNLGLWLGRRFSRTVSTADLEEAILVARQALEMVSEDHPNWTMHLDGLGTLLDSRYSVTGELVDLEETIKLARQALAATPNDHRGQAARLFNLGSMVRRKYNRIGDVADLDEFIQLMRQALKVAPEDEPTRADILEYLGSGLIKKIKCTKNMVYLEEAIDHLRSALYQSNASAECRITTGRAVILACMITLDWQLAEEASTIVMNLIPQLVSRSLQNSDKQYMLRSIVGIASDAAVIAFQTNREALAALTYLEQGRGVLATSLEEMRVDIEHLRQRHPALANQFVNLRNELDHSELHAASLLEQEHSSPWRGQWTQRYDAATEFDKIIMEIRKQPGFEDFLTAPSGMDIQAAATSGPIVVINVSKRRCDAVLVEKDRIRALPLPRLKMTDIMTKVRTGRLESPSVLEWLWDVVASPILDALAITQPPSVDSWPHIWWIPTGLLSKFPLHAAGYHQSDSLETVLDRVISTYSPSVKAIIHGRQRSGTLLSPAKMLLVAMQNTPEHNTLPFAVNEVAMLHGLCESFDCTSIEPGRIKQDVITHLPSCKIFHFAGHGYTDSKNPLRSSLLLDDWRTDPLTVSTLLETNLRKGSPFLAYLSACGTGQIKDDKSVDESLHLISACQLAGFRHVIGTLWEVNDEACVDVSRITYEEIWKEGLTDESVSRGLHKAVRELRRRWLDEISFQENRSTRFPRDVVLCDDDEESLPLPWVPYVHFGV